ncbi:MAG: PKD domain-containing protein [Bacteroidales bacterium]|nr:PKD domain-containing protein [Bacteroidales bacterium]
MKKIFNLFATVAMTALALTACGPDNPTPTPPTPEPDPNQGNNGGTTELKADFTFEADALTVQFTSKAEGASAYLWDFGDENTSTEESPEHTYDAAGTYTVKLTVQDADGNAKSAEKDVTVAGAVKAYFTATAKTDRAGKFGKIFTLDATASENAASIVWDFGDGSEASTEFSVNHEFPEFDQTYTVKATVTGVGGDTDVYETSVEVIGYNELLKGGSMEEDDAQYWTILPKWITDMDYATPVEGKYNWQPYFGYTDDKPSGGEGGCLRLSPENQLHDSAHNFFMYQTIDVEAGDVLEISAEMKWGANNNDNGLLWFAICPVADVEANGQAPDGSAVIEIYNYWNVGTALPAYDGNFSNASGVLTADHGYSGDGASEVVTYTVAESGTYAFGIDYRNVWGTTFGPEIDDILFDSISVKIVL